MTTADHPPAHLDALDVRDRLLSALAAAETVAPGTATTGGSAAPPAVAWVSADPARIRSLPAGVTAFAWLTDGQDCWLWCETAGGAAGMGQAVIDLPPGRYLVDTLDAEARRWSAREAAEGGPLVVGVVLTGSPVALRIRRFDRPAPRERRPSSSGAASLP